MTHLNLTLRSLFERAELNTLLADIPQELHQIEIGSLALDSRFLKRGTLFFALQGANHHGLDYLKVLEKASVSLIIAEPFSDSEREIPESEIPLITLPNIASYIPQLAAAFYGKALESLNLIGITGTEGKTSVSQFIAKAFNALAKECAVIGTNGIGFLDNLTENTHTTPDLLALYQSLAEIEAEFQTRSINQDQPHPVALEVTSHALDQKRVEGLSFAVTLFNNLNRDHLDYHKTMEAYAEAKRRLFFEYRAASSVINHDDLEGRKILSELSKSDPHRRLISYGQREANYENHLLIDQLRLHHQGLSFTLHYRGEKYPIESALYGGFNAYNLTAMIGALLAFEIPMEEIVSIIPKITHVKGRMEMIPLKNGAVGVVDYAHKPNALKEALISLKEHLSGGRLITLFGCGGDRDRGKRPLMAKIAEAESDYVIVTSDNPRTESSEAIIDEIYSGFIEPDAPNKRRKEDRKEAILEAIELSRAGDIILVAGKGHEDYQIVGDKVLHFSDSEIFTQYNEE